MDEDTQAAFSGIISSIKHQAGTLKDSPDSLSRITSFCIIRDADFLLELINPSVSGPVTRPSIEL